MAEESTGKRVGRDSNRKASLMGKERQGRSRRDREDQGQWTGPEPVRQFAACFRERDPVLLKVLAVRDENEKRAGGRSPFQTGDFSHGVSGGKGITSEAVEGFRGIDDKFTRGQSGREGGELIRRFQEGIQVKNENGFCPRAFFSRFPRHA